MRNNPTLGIILSLVYLGIFLKLFFFTIEFEYLGPPRTDASFAFLPLVTITLPWSLVFGALQALPVIILYSLGYLVEYPTYYGEVSLFILVLSASINTYFIYRYFSTAPKAEIPRNESDIDEVSILWRRFNLYFWIIFVTSFVVYLEKVAMLQQYITIIRVFILLTGIGSIAILCYFGYAITKKKKYVVFGLLTSAWPPLSLIVGYIIIYLAKKKAVSSQPTPVIS